jgi:hypothetical protein
MKRERERERVVVEALLQRTREVESLSPLAPSSTRSRTSRFTRWPHVISIRGIGSIFSFQAVREGGKVQDLEPTCDKPTQFFYIFFGPV